MYNELNQLTTSENTCGVTTYSYDEAGNQTGHVDPDGIRYTYTWDDENRRTQLILPGGTTQDASYNGDGLRVQTSDILTADFLWDGQRYLAVTTSISGIPYNRQVYTQGLGMWGDLISRHGDFNEREWLHFDAIGSTRVMTGSNEAIEGTRLYDAYGTVVASTGALMIPLSYVGRYGYYSDAIYGPNPESEYYVRARYYDAGIGCWSSRDPAGFADGTNLYSYGTGNPTIKSDPSGRQVSGDPVGVAVICSVACAGFWLFCPKLVHICLCDFWVTGNKRFGTGWLMKLPDCPCSIGSPPTNPSPADKPDDWSDPEQASPTYHRVLLNAFDLNRPSKVIHSSVVTTAVEH